MDMNHIKKRQHRPLTATQQTVHAILDYIEQQGLQPGDALPTEERLIAITGVSRSVLREAISYLKGLSLITSRRGSGFRISQADPFSLFEILLRQLGLFGDAGLTELADLRRTLELGAIEKAVAAANAQQVETISRIADQMEALVEKPRATLRQYNRLEREFHCAITRPAGCRLLDVLNGALRTYFARTQRGRIDEPLRHCLEKSNREHRIIVEAFRLGDGAIARDVLRSHLAGLQDGE
jgi:DNA-binding FadR family transcriptional regulator